MMDESPRADLSPPLDGILVVALEQAVAAPFATRQLADLGARVIKVERPGRGDFARDYDDAAGDGMSSWFVWLNRSKQSVVADLKTAPGRRLLGELIARADVFICNLAPASVERLGLQPDRLAARHSRLVACELSGYGEEGPYAGRKAYDLLVQAEAGVLAVTGTADAPAKAGVSIADIAGGMYAYSGILSALLQRDRTGRGGVVRVSLLGALAEWMSHPLLQARLTGRAPQRTGARHASIVPYGGYLTADGDEILIAVQNEAEWLRLCGDVLGLPVLATDARFAGNGRRVARRDEVERQLRPAVAALPTAELLRRLEAARIAYASARGIDGVLTHPQLASRWATVTAGDRQVAVLRPPAWHGGPGGFAPVLGPVPVHGRDTAAVRAEIASGGPDGGPDGGSDGRSDGSRVTAVRADPFPVAALAALFDDGLVAPGPGERLPAYWHLAACAVPPRSGALGADGHPVTGLFTPPAALPRRMLAGGRLRVLAPVAVGARLTVSSRVACSADKQGRSGPLRFVTVESRFCGPGGEPVLVEEQDIVYRTAAPPGPGAPAAAAVAEPGPLLVPGGGRMRAAFRADPVALQRFSAATSNPHRIHYDHPYATGVEGYPGLVVHGPLLLLSLLELVRLDSPDRAVTAVAFRARSPVFAGDAIRLAGDLVGPARDAPAPAGDAAGLAGDAAGLAGDAAGLAGPGDDVLRLAARDATGREVLTCEVTLAAG